MAKSLNYRIIQYYNMREEATWYIVQKRVLWFFWNNMPHTCSSSELGATNRFKEAIKYPKYIKG